MIDLQQILQTNGYAIFHIDASAQHRDLPEDPSLSMVVSELMYDVEQLEAVRDERLESDKIRLEEIVNGLKKQ